MIGRFMGFISQEVRGLHAAAYVLAGAAFLSSLLALARDRLLAHTFGAGPELDIYYAAFRIPDLIFVGTGALVSVYILIPELARRNDESQRRYLDTVLASFSVLAVVVAGFAALVAPALLSWLYPELARAGHVPLLTTLTRIMLLQPILLGVSNIFAGVTQLKGRYTLYAMSPLMYNLGIILGVAVFYPLIGIKGLAWGVVCGAFLHMAIQLPSVWRDGFATRLPRIYEWADVWKTVFVSLPRALTLSMTQVTFLGLTALAALLAPGSIAIFMFAFNLQAVPLTIIGASYSVAAFPTLAAALSSGERGHFLDQVALAARYVIFWSLPATALIVVLRAHLVRVVLGSGQFDWVDTRLTAAVFALLAFSLVAQGLSLLIVRAYYAAGRTFAPFAVSLVTALGTIGLAAWIVRAFDNPLLFWATRALLRVSDVPGSRILALGIAFSIASIAGTIGLLVHFERRFGGFHARILQTAWQSLFASFCAAAAAYLALVLVGPVDVGSTTASVFLRGLAGGTAGLLAAALAFLLVGSREFAELVTTIRTRMPKVAFPFGRSPVAVASSAEDQAQ